MRDPTSRQINNKTNDSEMRQAAPPLRINTSHGTKTVLSRCSTNEGHPYPHSQSGGIPVPPVAGFRPLVWNDSQPQYTHNFSHGARPDISQLPHASYQGTYPEAWHAHQHQIRQHNAQVEPGSRVWGPHVRMPLDTRTQQGLVPDAQRLTVANQHNYRLEEGERQVARIREETNKLNATVRDIKTHMKSLEQVVKMNGEDIGRLMQGSQDYPRESDAREQPAPFRENCNRCQRQSLEDVTEINAPSLESIECGQLDVKGTAPRNASVVVVTDGESIKQNFELSPRPRLKDEPVPASIRYNLRRRKKDCGTGAK
jgi:hypothetical protein